MKLENTNMCCMSFAFKIQSVTSGTQFFPWSVAPLKVLFGISTYPSWKFATENPVVTKVLIHNMILSIPVIIIKFLSIVLHCLSFLRIGTQNLNSLPAGIHTHQNLFYTCVWLKGDFFVSLGNKSLNLLGLFYSLNPFLYCILYIWQRFFEACSDWFLSSVQPPLGLWAFWLSVNDLRACITRFAK